MNGQVGEGAEEHSRQCPFRTTGGDPRPRSLASTLPEAAHR